MMATSNFLVPNGTFIVELVGLLDRPRRGRPLRAAAAQRGPQGAPGRRSEAELEAADAARADAAAADEERRQALEDARQQAREIVRAGQAGRRTRRVAEAVAAAARRSTTGSSPAPTAEVNLARQRALEEATAQLGRAGHRRGRAGHRPRGRRRGPPRPGRRGRSPARARRGPRRRRGGHRDEPGPRGVRGRGAQGAVARATGALADELPRSSTWSGRNVDLRSALTDTAVAAAGAAGRRLGPLEGRVGEPARRLAAYAVAAVPGPRGARRLRLAGPPGRQASEGRRLDHGPARAPGRPRNRVGGLRDRPVRGRGDRRRSRRSRTSCSASPASSRPTPQLRGRC